MVKGLDTFRRYFQGYENQYVLIGGAACDIVFENSETAFRATRDVLDWQSRECSGAELLDEFYEQTSENQPAQLVIVHYLVSEELITARCISIP